MPAGCGCGSGGGSTTQLWQVTLPSGAKETYSNGTDAEARAIATGGTYRRIT